MSSSDVRAALVSFFESANIPGLNKVHPAPPYWADGSEWQLNLQGGSGSIGAIHLIEDTESRITVPVLTGQKSVGYNVGLMVFYQWLKPRGLTPVDEASWVGPLDTIIDGIKARIRSDPNCGMPATVFQSGQENEGIKTQRDLPRQLDGKVVSWNVIEFKVTEIITA